MTTEERLNRIEHITAGLAEERRRDREEDRQLWRQTQQHLDETASHIDKLSQNIDRFVAEAAARDLATNQRISEADRASRERDEKLDARIQALVLAIGQLIHQPNRQS